MTLAQLEYADTYADPLPADETMDALEDLFIARRREIITIKNKRLQLGVFERRHPDGGFSDRCALLQNQLTQAEIELVRIRREIVEVAEQIVAEDRKSTRLNSSHLGISYAVFCLKKK